MHSDIERQSGHNPHQSWSVNGLDLIFPDVGPIETTDLPLDVLVEKTANIIQRWWKILDGATIDTSREKNERPRGVLREMTFQYLRSRPKNPTDSHPPQDYEAYQNLCKSLSVTAQYAAAHLLYVHRYDIVQDKHIPEDEAIDCPDTNEHREIAELWSTNNLWQFQNTLYQVIHHPLNGSVSGYIEFIEGKWQIRFDDAMMENRLTSLMKNKLQKWIRCDVSPLYTQLTLDYVKSTKIFWAFDYPQDCEPKADFLRRCQKYWENALELDVLKQKYSTAWDKSKDNNYAAKAAFSSVHKYNERFLEPARIIIQQTPSERITKRQVILIAGWIKALSRMYPRYYKALRFEYEDAYRGLHLELPAEVLAAVGEKLSLKEATQLPKTVVKSIIDQYSQPSNQNSIDNIALDELYTNEITLVNPIAQFEEQESLNEQLREAQLSEEEGKVFRLILQGYTESEIAGLTYKAIGTVRSLRARALKKIR